MDTTIRAQFPILDEITYLNSASVCLMSLVSQQAGQQWRETVYRKRPDALDAWRAEMASALRTVADFIGAQPEEIAFTGNTSDGEAFVAAGSISRLVVTSSLTIWRTHPVTSPGVKPHSALT